jgi:hypothetical protein
MQNLEDADGSGFLAGDARAWLAVRSYMPDRKLVGDLAGVSFECLERFVRSKPWWLEDGNYQAFADRIPQLAECPVCEIKFTITRKQQVCCTPECQKARDKTGQSKRYRARVG